MTKKNLEKQILTCSREALLASLFQWQGNEQELQTHEAILHLNSYGLQILKNHAGSSGKMSLVSLVPIKEGTSDHFSIHWQNAGMGNATERSEERRVGKEC